MTTSAVSTTILIVTRIFGSLSFAASLATASEAVAEWYSKGRRVTVATQIQTVLQVPMLVHAACIIIGTTAAPGDSDLWGAVGTTWTCTLQGFALHAAISAGVWLDALLSLTYLLCVKYEWSENRLKELVPVAVALTATYTASVTSFALYQSFYGPTYEVCFLAYPVTCTTQEEEGEEHANVCSPTPPALLNLRLLLLLINMLHLVFSMHVVWTIYRLALRAAAPPHVSRRIAIKGCLYALAVASVQIPTAAWVVVSIFLGRNAVILGKVVTLVLPLTGLFNFLVFMLNRREMRTPYGRVARKVVDGGVVVWKRLLSGNDAVDNSEISVSASIKGTAQEQACGL